MIVMEFGGGLGNQMSQYAMLKLLESKYPNTKIYGNISIYKKTQVHNGFELENIYGKGIDIKYWGSCIDKVKFLCHKTYCQKYMSGYPIDETLFNLPVNKHNYKICGTFHNYDYSSIRDTLMDDFVFPPILDEKNKECLNEIQKTNSVSVHLRRGDYVDIGLDICGKEYYNKAMEIVEGKLRDIVYYVFSDDEKEAKIMFGDKKNVVYVTHNKGTNSYRDMQLMSKCKHNIIANSTFSYWGAWLNSNEEKIVIRPRMQTPTRATWEVKDWILV